MVSLADAPVKLFEGQLPSFEDIRKLSAIVNASERNRIAFRQESEKQSNALLSGLGFFVCCDYAAAAEKLSKGKDCVQKCMALGFIYRRQKRLDAAIEQFDKAAKAGADALTVSLEKADTFRWAGAMDKVQKELKHCANYENVSAAYHFQMGRLLDAQGEYEKAMAQYAKAIELDPNHADATFHLAYSCDLRGDEDAALNLYKQLAKRVPPPINALLNLAVLHEDRGEFEKAEVCVDMVLTSHPNHAKAALFLKDIQSSRYMVYDEEKEKRRDRHNKILEIPISDFELSVRSRNCLKKMNIITLGDLLRTTEAELLSYKNFGETSLVEIKKILDSKNLHLGMALEDKLSGKSADAEADSQACPELLQKGIEDLELSVRARRALGRLGVKSLFELVNKTEPELLGCKNFGVTSLNEIKEKLTNFGLSLRKTD
jgi:DNA-directed RNA polymerase subunit alpha